MWSYAHRGFLVHQIPALRDNYIYLIESQNSDILAVIDPAEAHTVKAVCKQLDKPLTHILNTHHHWDHTDGNQELKDVFDCIVVGAKLDEKRIPAITETVNDGDTYQLGDLAVQVIGVPGHTSGHIAFVIADALFCGDTIFGAGCGRLFEGTHKQMWESLQKLAALPLNTQVYCAHEYTLSNLRFARLVDKGNNLLDERISCDTQSRMAKLPTIPSTIELERATNPFIRPISPFFCKRYAKENNTAEDSLSVFTHMRKSRDQL